jgi:hypothetical protein
MHRARTMSANATTKLGPDLVRAIVDGTKAEVLRDLGRRIDAGLRAEDLANAAAVASARAIRPRPYLSTEYHAFLSAYAAQETARVHTGRARFLPLLWHVAALKDAQVAHGVRGRSSLSEGPLHAGGRPLERLAVALRRWDEDDIDAAAAFAIRYARPAQVADLLVASSARDLRDMGHKTIAVANGLRSARSLSGAALEGVVRSIALALVRRDEDEPNPSLEPHAELDLPCARNEERLARIAVRAGEMPTDTERELLSSLRMDDAERAADLVADLLARATPLDTILAAQQLAAAELVLRAPEDTVAIHALTTMNALRTCIAIARNLRVKAGLVLQATTRLVTFRDQIEELSSASLADLAIDGPPASISFPPRELAARYREDTLGTARLVRKAVASGSFDDDDLCSLRRAWLAHATDFHDVKIPTAVADDASRLPRSSRAVYLGAALAHVRSRLVERSEGWNAAHNLLWPS